MSSDFLSKYKIHNKVGEGTFSEVLRCTNLVTGEVVAVKRLKRQFNQLGEAESLPELFGLLQLTDHKNVLTLIEYIFEHNAGKLYLVFELMEMNLIDYIQSHKRCIAESKVKSLFYQLLKGVNYLHTNNFFHRDIKPENILLKSTVLKLADLGSVRASHSKQPYTEYISTRWYRAPECILTEGRYGSKMDVWACGCVYYEMLTSNPLFPGANEIDQLTKIHQVTGTPCQRVIAKLRGKQSRVSNVKFTGYPSVSPIVVLPFSSEAGRELLMRMIAYDPAVRSSVHVLLEHRYFNDLREKDCLLRPFEKRSSNTSLIKGNKSLYNFQTYKQKESSSSVRDKTGTNLIAKSYGPSTSNYKTNTIFPSSKIYAINEVTSYITQNSVLSRQKQDKKLPSSDKRQKIQPTEERTSTKAKPRPGRLLPPVGHTGLSRLPACNINVKHFRPTKGILPPISELEQVL